MIVWGGALDVRVADDDRAGAEVTGPEVTADCALEEEAALVDTAELTADRAPEDERPFDTAEVKVDFMLDEDGARVDTAELPADCTTEEGARVSTAEVAVDFRLDEGVALVETPELTADRAPEEEAALVEPAEVALAEAAAEINGPAVDSLDDEGRPLDSDAVMSVLFI